MKCLNVIAVFVMCAGSVLGQSSLAPASKAEDQNDHIPKTVAESVSNPLEFAEGSFLGVAEAMPEAKYSFIPTAGKFDDARSFG